VKAFERSQAGWRGQACQPEAGCRARATASPQVPASRPATAERAQSAQQGISAAGTRPADQARCDRAMPTEQQNAKPASTGSPRRSSATAIVSTNGHPHPGHQAPEGDAAPANTPEALAAV